MSDDLVDLDTMQLFLFQSGIPQRELLRQDHRLSSRTMTREHFDITRRLMYIRVRLQPHQLELRQQEVEHRRFLARLRLERDLRRQSYARVIEAGVAIRGLECFRQVPALVPRVLSFVADPNLELSAVHSHIVIFFLADGCRTVAWGFIPFLDHLESAHLPVASHSAVRAASAAVRDE